MSITHAGDEEVPEILGGDFIRPDVSRETYPVMPPADLPPCDTVAALETLQRELAQVKEALNTLGGMMNMFGEMNAKLYQVLGGVGEAFGELSPIDKIKLVKDLMTNG